MARKKSDAALMNFIHDSSHQTGGAGTRGGHVLGYTRTGKPIYEGHKASHPDYAGFQPADHSDALELHGHLADFHGKVAGMARHSDGMAQSAQQAMSDLVSHHHGKHQSHEEAASSHFEARFPGLPGKRKTAL